MDTHIQFSNINICPLNTARGETFDYTEANLYVKPVSESF